MAQFKVVIPDPFSPDLAPFERAFSGMDVDLVVPEGDDWTEVARDADGMIVNLIPVDAQALDKLEKCRVIARLGTGTDNVDGDAARARDIAVCNVADYCGDEVSEHVLSFIFALNRHITAANFDMQKSHWGQVEYRPIRRLSGQTLGLVGYGKLARAVARKAIGVGLRVIAYDPYAATDAEPKVSLVTLDELLAQADVISLHTPLIDATRNILNAERIKAMKPGSLLINAARGGLVDEDALAEAIESGHLGGAGLDVFSTEPLAKGSRLLGKRNVLLTPHMAFYSEQSLESLQFQAAQIVAEALAGQPIRNVVNSAKSPS